MKFKKNDFSNREKKLNFRKYVLNKLKLIHYYNER